MPSRNVRSISALGTPSSPALSLVHRQPQVGATQAHRVVHVLRALGARPAPPRTRAASCAQRVEARALDAHGDRRVDRRTVLELLDLDARARIPRQLLSQRVEHARRLHVVVRLEQHEQLRAIGRLGALEDVVVHLRVVLPDVREDAPACPDARRSRRSAKRAARSVSASDVPSGVSMSTWYCGVPALGKSEKPTTGTSAHGAHHQRAGHAAACAAAPPARDAAAARRCAGSRRRATAARGCPPPTHVAA